MFVRFPSFRDRRAPALSSEVEDELGRMLFATIVPKTIIGVAAAGLALLLWARGGAPAAAAIALASVLVTAYRVGCVLTFRRIGQFSVLAPWVNAYAAGNFAFSTVLASFAAVAFAADSAHGELMAAILIVAYCAGVVARASVRPWIAIGSILLAAGPLAAVCMAQFTPEYAGISLVLVALILGSIDTVFHTHRMTAEQLAARQRFAELAALDALTGLSNRKMLLSRLEELFDRDSAFPVAVHYLDLDHFKPINDTFGHAAGDAILVEVARRLTSVLGDGAFAARVGGDEFVVVQPKLEDPEDGRILCRKLIAAIAEPIEAGGRTMIVEASDGCFIADPQACSPVEALAAADAALYEAKRGGRNRGIVRSAVVQFAA